MIPEENIPREQWVYDSARKNGVGFLRPLVEQGFELAPHGQRLLEQAVCDGDVELARYVIERGIPVAGVSQAAFVRGANNADLSLLRLLAERGFDVQGHGGAALADSVARGDRATFTFLLEHGVSLSAVGEAHVAGGARTGGTGFLQYVSEFGLDLQKTAGLALREAVARADEATFRFLLERGVDLHRIEDADVAAAARAGGPAFLQKISEVGIQIPPLGAAAASDAAMRGDVALLTFLRERFGSEHEAMTQALVAAARAGQAGAVCYLHEHGVAHSAISPESRATMQAMADEIGAAEPDFRPSQFWQVLNSGSAKLVQWGGEDNFKRTVNQIYFNFIPQSWFDAKIVNALRLLARVLFRVPWWKYRLDDPDNDPGSWVSWYPDYQLFRGDRALGMRLYKLYVIALYEYARRTPGGALLDELEEPETGNPIRLWRGSRRISQDLVNSVCERNTLCEALGHAPARHPLVLGELGAGYGRLAYVLLATTRARVFVFDIPPALHLSQWYLSRLFPERRIFPFRHFERFDDIAAEAAHADIAFFTANQLALFPDNYFDVFVNISSLHEMRLTQIRRYLDLISRVTRALVYLKQYTVYDNPHDAIRITREDFRMPAGWQEVMEREDTLNPGFFELVLRRQASEGGGR